MTMQDQLNALTSQLYEGVLSAEHWTGALMSISAFAQCPNTTILEFNAQSGQSSLTESFGLAQETLEAYNAHYYQLDVIESAPLATALAEGGWYHDRRDLGENTIRRSEYYNDFFFRHGLGTITSNRLVISPGVDIYLSMQRLRGQPYFSDADYALFNRFIPHLQRALRIRLQMRGLSERAGLSQLVLNQVRLALLVLDERGQLLLANAQAEALLRRIPQLPVRGGQLKPQGLRPGMFERLLASACGRTGAVQAGAALLSDAQGQTTLQLLVLPLPASLHAINPWQRPLAMVVLSEPDKPLSVQQHLLHQLYGLTAAEARVAQAIYQGDTPAQAAEHLGVTVGTVRSQLKAIFAKTGASRQAELIRLLSVLRMVG